MQIVINIPEDMYSKIKKFDGRHDVLIDRGDLYEAICNGTVLPKGHGRLIDIDKAIKTSETVKDNFCMIQDPLYGKVLCCSAPTVVEADDEDDKTLYLDWRSLGHLGPLFFKDEDEE